MPESLKQFEMLELWREIRFGIPARLTIEPLQRIQAAWRSSEDFNERTTRTMSACKAEGEGIWEDLSNAGLEAVYEADKAAHKLYHRKLKMAEKSSSLTIGDRIRDEAGRMLRDQFQNGVVRAWGVDHLPENQIEGSGG